MSWHPVFKWLSSRTIRRTRRARTPRCRWRFVQPRLEPLEDRLVITPFTVTNLSDSAALGSSSLRAAIEAADIEGGANTVDFQVSGTIILTNGALPIVNNDLTIQGPAAGLTINAQRRSRIFEVGDSGNPGALNVALSGLTLTGGDAGSNLFGGAIDNFEKLSLMNCTLTGNSAFVGGGIENDGTAVLTNCTLADNSAGEGGGIFNIRGTAVLTNCNLADNSAGFFGGGIVNNLGGKAALTNCTLADNTALGGGGIINAAETALLLTNCTLADNSAIFGGGIDNLQAAELLLTNCTLADNSAESGGGILNRVDGTAALANCTLADNLALFGGGILNGFGNEDASMILLNTIVADSTRGGDAVNEAMLEGSNNLIVELFSFGGTNDLMNTISGDTQLGPLQDNGGPTQTKAIPTSSPAFQAGLFIPLVTTDQRGLPRQLPPSLGAFEPQVPFPPSPPPSPSPSPPPPSPTSTTNQLTTLHIAPNVLNLSAQVTLTVQVSSPAGTVNQGLVTFTLAGLSVQGTVHNGTANASVVIPLLSLVLPMNIPSTYADNSASALFGPSSAVTPVVFNLFNALLPSVVTLASGTQHTAISFPFFPLEFFYHNLVLSAIRFGPLVL